MYQMRIFHQKDVTKKKNVSMGEAPMKTSYVDITQVSFSFSIKISCIVCSRNKSSRRTEDASVSSAVF